MQTAELIERLGYDQSSNFLPVERLGDLPEHAHVFRRAVKSCALKGVFVLRGLRERTKGVAVPVVYVAEAESYEEADRLHRRVWNQNVVPFLLVRTPLGVRLYSGFNYGVPPPGTTDSQQRGVLEAAVDFNEVHDRLSEFRANAINDGSLWRKWGKQIDPSRRVDWHLLNNLKQLGSKLRKDLDPEVAHALIGKFVYLSYLRDRDHLSDRRLEDWNIDLRCAFGRNATIKEFRRVVDKVDDWLNGSVFPLRFSGISAPTVEHVRQVASVFLGDEPETGQLHLDFSPYDFSHIPIETLSVIYEQFLAYEGKKRKAGAYYTPIALVNFMLAELDNHHPLKNGMRVLDPACGSGAFLVQCYRRLIEREMLRKGGQMLRPVELRNILVRHIFGVDNDGNACRVAEFSLILTMLDYIEPPDLQRTPTFKLPVLSEHNIFEGDFFDGEAGWNRQLKGTTFDWIVGNPPWICANPKSADAADKFALRWMKDHKDQCPVTGNQVAEAFAWKVAEHLSPRGIVGLLIPAMSLFKNQRAFRQSFFRQMDVQFVANFTNLKEVLFAGRSRLPAAMIMYAPASISRFTSRRSVLVFSPLVINQEANRVNKPGGRKETWAITINGSELRDLDQARIAEGSNLPWKIAMWGSTRDQKLLERIASQFPSFEEFAERRKLKVHQGIELREKNNGSSEQLDAIPEVAGKLELDTEVLSGLGQIYAFPPGALNPVSSGRSFLRKRGGRKGLEINKPPHIIVSAATKFAVFSDTFLVVPPRQIGVAGGAEQEEMLRACAVYLGSQFVRYHQFLTSSRLGVVKGSSTLAAFRKIPTPLADLDSREIRRLAEFQRALAAESREMWEYNSDNLKQQTVVKRSPRIQEIERNVEDAVSNALGLSERDRCLIDDLVGVRMRLVDGQVASEAIRAPSDSEMTDYAEALRIELDEFLGSESGLSHRVSVVRSNLSAMIEIELLNSPRPLPVTRIMHADEPTAEELNRMQVKLSRGHEQWLYFDRNLFLHRDDRSYIFKPMERIWWLRSQALQDADEVLATALVPGDQ
ncbi:MAG: N-6 DNA methylase [SAR324 cluster bacterium]|nr:N-6 DNA methylase [SAR324 cluster bacterium]